jgi:carboxypeptidase family protein
LVAAAQPAEAQGTAVLSGQLLDRASGTPVVGASVILLGSSVVLRSDTSGRFTRADLRPGTYVVQVRSLGYSPVSRIIDLQDGQALALQVELDQFVIGLAGVVIEGERYVPRGMRGFEERRMRGRGVYVTEADIKERGAAQLGDVLRSVAGVREVCRRGVCRVRMARSDCAPNFFVDGFPANNSTTLELPVIGIIAIEIYRTIAETPPDFLRGATGCGTIAIWTRTGL